MLLLWAGRGVPTEDAALKASTEGGAAAVTAAEAQVGIRPRTNAEFSRANLGGTAGVGDEVAARGNGNARGDPGDGGRAAPTAPTDGGEAGTSVAGGDVSQVAPAKAPAAARWDGDRRGSGEECIVGDKTGEWTTAAATAAGVDCTFKNKKKQAAMQIILTSTQQNRVRKGTGAKKNVGG